MIVANILHYFIVRRPTLTALKIDRQEKQYNLLDILKGSG
jgi:hypothetical protein